MTQVPPARHNSVLKKKSVCRPRGTHFILYAHPPLKGWAIFLSSRNAGPGWLSAGWSERFQGKSESAIMSGASRNWVRCSTTESATKRIDKGDILKGTWGILE
jgi:hypothetical protein